MAKQHNRGSRPGFTALVAVIGVLVLLLAAGCAFLLTRYTWAAGGLREKGAAYMDLRGEELSMEDFRELTEKFPDCQILWDVPFQGFRVSSDANELTVSDLTGADCQALEYLPNLTRLIALHCQDDEAVEAFAARHPECRVSYPIPIEDEHFPNDAAAITIADADVAQLEQVLHLFDNLAQVTLTGRIPGEAEMDDLIATFPDIFFLWPVPVGNTTVDSSAVQLDLQGEALDYPEIAKLLKWMPRLTWVNLLGCSLTDDQVLQLAADYPNCRFLWELEINGQRYRTDAEELDLSGWQVGSSQAVEKLLPCFFNLKRVVMSDCGLDDETMDELNQRYEDIRFIWTVYIKDVPIRTDAKWFYPFKYQKDMVVGEEDLYPLRYCVDMEAIDIGHMTTVETCDWVAYMPNLKYLIIVETAITDISPLANLKNLVFLEIFTTKITDYSPLLGCTALEDLNLGQTYGDPEPILQMTWLKNLWWSGIEGTYGLPCSDAPQRLREALPNTNMKFNLETPNVNNGWRQLENYYAMRDLMDVFYLS